MSCKISKRQVSQIPVLYQKLWETLTQGIHFEVQAPNTVGRWFPPGTPVSSTRKLVSSSFHRLDMTLAVAEALNPNKPNQIQLNRPVATDINLWCAMPTGHKTPTQTHMSGTILYELPMSSSITLSIHLLCIFLYFYELCSTYVWFLVTYDRLYHRNPTSYTKCYLLTLDEGTTSPTWSYLTTKEPLRGFPRLEYSVSVEIIYTMKKFACVSVFIISLKQKTFLLPPLCFLWAVCNSSFKENPGKSHVMPQYIYQYWLVGNISMTALSGL